MKRKELWVLREGDELESSELGYGLVHTAYLLPDPERWVVHARFVGGIEQVACTESPPDGEGTGVESQWTVKEWSKEV